MFLENYDYLEEDLEIMFEFKCCECSEVAVVSDVKSCEKCGCSDFEVLDAWEQ